MTNDPRQAASPAPCGDMCDGDNHDLYCPRWTGGAAASPAEPEEKTVLVDWKWYDNTGCGKETWNPGSYQTARVPSGTDKEIRKYILEELVDPIDRSLEGFRGVSFRKLPSTPTAPQPPVSSGEAAE